MNRASSCSRTRPATASAARDDRRRRARGRRSTARGRGRPARRASLTRNTAERYALVAMNSAPIRIERGLSQLVTASPAALPTGTRPPAIAPTTVPMKNGVSSDASPEERSATARPPRAPRGLVEGESRAAQDDAERGQAERDEQRREDRLERGREAGPEHHEHEDQPDVIGLPYGSDRPVDQLARAATAVVVRRPAGSTGPRRSRLRRRRRRSSRRSRGRPPRRRLCSSRAFVARSSGGSRGRPVRARRPHRSASVRQRRAIARSVMTSAAPSTT